MEFRQADGGAEIATSIKGSRLPLLATSRHAAAQNRLPLIPQLPTFWPRLGRSQVDPQETWALPLEAENWSLTTLRDKLVKTGAKVVSHGRYVTFQLAEVAVPRELFRKILSLIDGLRRRPAPA